MISPATARALATIELAGRQKATGLDLHAFGLKELPPLPAELRLLRDVNLGRNRLTKLPPDFWQLTQLQRLDLGSNRLAEIPPGVRNLEGLARLDVSENRLTLLPRELGGCLQLTELCAYDNRLAEVPEEIASLKKLLRLDLSANCLEQMTFPVGAFQRLEELNLSNNRLAQLPTGIGGLDNLRVLNVSGNRLGSVGALVTLPKLEELYLDDNLLATLPEEIAGLPSLRLISAAGNRFDQLPAAFDKVAVPELKKQAEAAVRAHTAGGPEPGGHYFIPPPYIFDFLLAIGSFTGVMRVVDLYYQRFQERVSLSLKFPDGSTVELKNLSRKAAIEIVREHEKMLASGRALFDLQGTEQPADLQTITDLAVRAVLRVPVAELVPKTGQAVPSVTYIFNRDVVNSKFAANPAEEKIMRDKYTTGNIIGSNVSINSNLQNVRETIGAAKTVDDTTKAQLDQLLQQLSENLKKLPAEKATDAEAVAEAAGDLVKKATADKPNQKSVEISGKGLLEAAEGIASVVPIALKIVSTVSKFVTGI